MADHCSVAVKIGDSTTVQCEEDMGHRGKHHAEIQVLYIPDIDFPYSTDSTATVTWGRGR